MTLTDRLISIAAAFLVAAMVLALGLSTAVAAPFPARPPSPTLNITIYAETQGGKPTFVLHGSGTDILVGSVPTQINVTFVNNDSVPEFHTFSINSAQAATGPPIINGRVNATGDVTHVGFILNTTTKVQVNSTATAVNAETSTDANGQFIRFYCQPHRSAGMVGQIRLRTSAGAPPTIEGFQLWAFWIGSIAMVATLGFMGVTYFIIKASSRHNTDEREHIRRGLP
jgi:plastocyanin